jgi:hypothetical protein
MCLLRRDGRADRIMLVGFFFLLLANLSQLIFRRMPSLGEAMTDATTGLLFGIAITSLLLGIWRKGHAGSNSRPRSSV